MGITRREALKVMVAATGAAVATARIASRKRGGGGRGSARCARNALRRDPAASAARRAWWRATRPTTCRPTPRTSDGRWQMPLDLNEHTKNIIKLYQDPTERRSRVHQAPVHALPRSRPALRPACLARCRSASTASSPTSPTCASAAATARWPARSTSRSSSGRRRSPKIVKCELCKHRIAQGKGPACCEVCPTSAVIYGKRADLLAEAHGGSRQYPDRYVHHVYGEHEAGGTQVLYLARARLREARSAGVRRRAGAGARALGATDRLQGLHRSGGAVRVLVAVLMRNRASREEERRQRA